MTTATDLRRTIAALFCTIVFSTICVLAAVAPGAAVAAAPIHQIAAPTQN